MEKVKNRKEWVKNAIIIFLIVMLVLTFCSNSIMNMCLPEVSTEAVSAGKVQESIRGTGIAELANGYQIMLKESRVVKQVNVKIGQEVKAGDVLFVLEPSDGMQVEEAKNTYLDLQTEYQKKLLGTEYVYDKETLAIENAKEEYDSAVDKYKSIDKTNKLIEKKKKKLTSYENKIAKKENAIAKYDEEITDLLAKTDITSLKAELILKQRSVVSLKNELSDIEADLNALIQAGDASAEITELERQKRDKNVEVTNAENDVKLIEDDIKNADSNVKALETAKNNKDKDVELLAGYKVQQTVLTEEIEQLKATVLTKEEAKVQMNEKENMWNTLVLEYEEKQREDKYTQETEKIELNSAKQKLIAQKKLVEELIAETESDEIVAKQDGQISAVSIAAGEMTQPDMPLAVIASSENGYEVKISVTKEQALKVKQGQSANVENYWDGDINAVVTSITASAENPAESDITLAVNAEYITPGDSLAMSIGGESKMYDVVVPRSSIYEDNNGKFVLTLDSKNTPLGNRYVATRHEVEVIVQNDTKAAISSDLQGYEYVIVAASEAISPGEQVKLKE